MKPIKNISVAVLIALAFAVSAGARTFHTTWEKVKTLDGELIKAETTADGVMLVTLKLDVGGTKKVKINAFTAEDQEYIQEKVKDLKK